MKRSSGQVAFDEMRRFLMGLGFKDRHADGAWIFHHPEEGLIVFRDYAADEAMDEGDLRSTRLFLDMRGRLDGKDFDTFVQRATTPA
jgi:hypothetical protein